MKPEEIKIGETYNVRMYVSHYSKGIISCSTVIGYDKVDGIQCGEEYDICHDEISAFSPILPENGIKNSEPATKYAPCRKFRKGDRVRVVERNGRNGTTSPSFTGALLTVAFNEVTAELLCLFDHEKNRFYIDPAYIELVTPIEERERYIVDPGDVAWFVIDTKRECGNLNAVIFFNDTHPNAKAAAEAECERLNAEHRKEQE